MAEEVYYQIDGGGEIRSISADQIPSFDTDGRVITSIPSDMFDRAPSDTTHHTPITLNTTINYAPNGFGTPYADGWTTIDYATYDPNEWVTTTTPYLQVDRNGIARWYQNGQPGESYVWANSNLSFTYPDEPTRHADPKPEPVDTHELDEFIDSLKVVEGEDDV